MKDNIPIIIIAGPTASGKSSFAINLAKLINGSIVNFDSMQVYKDLEILTARPNKDDLMIVPHKLYGVISGDIRCTAVYWRNLALKEIDDIKKLGRVPIFVGGTGLYIKALIDGISDVPKSITKFKNNAENLLKEVGPNNFYNIVKNVDPEIVKNISLNDYQRLVRVYTVWLQTNIPLSEWHKKESFNKERNNVYLKIRIKPDRKILRENIKKRFIEMINIGVIEEVKKFKRFDDTLPIMKAHGLREIIAYIDGKKELNEVISETTNKINQYAKRQDTWFRNKYLSDYDIMDTNKNVKVNCTNILSLHREMYT